MGKCVVCGGPVASNRATCSESCHEFFIKQLEKQFGKYKKVVDATTGTAYRVPTCYIVENGLKQTELSKFPLWGTEPNEEERFACSSR